mmetsp:Transcript_118518/g.369130  ORF Transcript_118518/g.369130 Transcript_118518/m.369130 type:complete len:156 (+) Transcript_118518:117-584(+)
MPPKGKAKSGAGKAKPKGKAKAKAADSGFVLLGKETPLTPEEKEWCEGFQGVPLMGVSVEDLPVPPTLNSPQVRIWRRIWEQGQEILKGSRSDAADDAMRQAVQRMHERAADADPDTQVVIEHVRVWLRWFDESAAAAISFMDGLSDGDDDEEDG